jgi:hypothetical protein
MHTVLPGLPEVYRGLRRFDRAASHNVLPAKRCGTVS